MDALAAGYNSDIDISSLNYVGNFPIENSLGGFGETTGSSDDYLLSLTPKLKSGYRKGLMLQVRFHQGNRGRAVINVDNKGVVPIKKVTPSGVLKDLELGNLSTGIHYLLIYDGNSFQVASGIVTTASSVPATESNLGIVKLSNTRESNDPSNNTTAISPQKLIAYVSDKITGLWENKGHMDCSSNPPFPKGASGDAYTVSTPGKIGGRQGIEVQNNDVIHCLEDNPGGTSGQVGSKWNVIQANLVKSTESIAGIVKLATQAMVNTGTDDASVITPLKLMTLLNNKNATEGLKGLIQLATQAVVNTGTDDEKAITPLKLKVRLANYLNRETLLSIAANHIGTTMYHTPGRKLYSAINGNLIIIHDIRLKRSTSNVGAVNGWVLNMPKPLNGISLAAPGMLLSTDGQKFFYYMDGEGRLHIKGSFTNAGDELLLNIKPYIAQYPLVYHGTTPP